MLIFLAGLQNIPGDVYEAAQLDGINKWQRFHLHYVTFVETNFYFYIYYHINWRI